MKTNQIMKREFYDTHVEQRTKDGFFNATTLLKYFNDKTGARKKIKQFFHNKNTIEFLDELDKDSRGNNSYPLKLYMLARHRHESTWMHPYLFVKFAMWLSPKFELQVIKFVYDNLITYRIRIGDDYKEMCHEINCRYRLTVPPTAFSSLFISEANHLNQLVFGIPEGNKRNQATEQQLALMRHLQKANTKMLRQGVSQKERFHRLDQFAGNYSA